MSCCTKLRHGEGQVEIGRRLARFSSTTMPGLPWAHSAGHKKTLLFACQFLSASGVRFGGSGNWVREYLMTTGTKYRTIIPGIELDA